MAERTKIALVSTSDRKDGVERAIDLLGVNPAEGREVFLKPNFNTADEFPGSTHNDTLIAMIEKLKKMGSKKITVGDRSGPVSTASVLKDKGIQDICDKHDVELINFEELPDTQWVHIKPELCSWRNGFFFARPVIDSECVVTSGCLKTHKFGAVFTISLKLSIGMVHGKNMTELHTSLLSMRKMIAEVNQAYDPSLIVIDAIEAFVDGGPMTGEKRTANIIYAGTDRVAIDAVGVAILKELGSKKDIMQKPVFEQQQIARAIEIGLGIKGPGDIELVTNDSASEERAEKIMKLLGS